MRWEWISHLYTLFTVHYCMLLDEKKNFFAKDALLAKLDVVLQKTTLFITKKPKLWICDIFSNFEGTLFKRNFCCDEIILILKSTLDTAIEAHSLENVGFYSNVKIAFTRAFLFFSSFFSTRKGNTYLCVIKSTFSSNSPDGILQEPLQRCNIHFRDFTSTLFFLAKCFKHFFLCVSLSIYHFD